MARDDLDPIVQAFLLREAAASVRLDRDDRARTMAGCLDCGALVLPGAVDDEGRCESCVAGTPPLWGDDDNTEVEHG